MATNIPNISFPYISIRLANITLTWRGNAPDYFSSLTCDRYVNRANTGTINITYAPGPHDDPNAVEVALVRSKGDALLQYGQTNGRTKLQRCFIYDYKVNIDNGVLQYTMNFVSRSVVHNLTSVRAMTLKKDNTKEDVLAYMKECVDKVKVNDQPAYVFDSSEAEDFEILQEISIGNDKSPFEALIQIAKGLRCVGDSEDPRYYYAIEVDDSYVGQGRVFLRKIDTQEVASEYTFNWGTKDSDVISWSIDYDGAVALARARGESTAEELVTGINESTGKMYTWKGTVPALEKPLASPDTLATIQATDWNQGEFSRLADHCYTASLTVIGQNKTLSIGKSIIQVNPMIYGKAHHSAGKYKVIGIKDSVNSSGFQTTYSLYKLNLEGQSGAIFPKEEFEKKDPQIFYNGAFHTYDDVEFFYEE